MKGSFRRFWVLACFCTIWMGCENSIPHGHFEGTLIRQSASGTIIQAVSIELSALNRYEVAVQILDLKKQPLSSLHFVMGEKGTIEAYIPEIQFLPFHLKKVTTSHTSKKTQCYADHENGSLKLCFDQHQFILKASHFAQSADFTLWGDQFKKEVEYPLEAPTSVSLDESIERALTHNLDSQISLKKTIEAKNTALTAWLNLLPHLSTSLVWNALPSYVTVIATLQGLVPFLLPSYWLQAKEASIHHKVVQDAHRITQADLAVSIEELFYSYQRDFNISLAHKTLLSTLQSQQYAKSIDINEVYSLVYSTQTGIDRVLKEDQYAISQALGYRNPNAVSGISIGVEKLPIEHAQNLDCEQVANWAIQRSFELKQMDYLIRIARLKNIELYFTWLDPSGDPKAGLGFNLIGQVKVSKSQREQLILKREKLKRTIYYQAHKVAYDFNLALEAYRKNEELIKKDFHSDFISVAEGSLLLPNVRHVLARLIQKETQLAAFRIARAKVDRFLLSGYYEKLLPELAHLSLESSEGESEVEAGAKSSARCFSWECFSVKDKQVLR